jgi:acyl-coenzyme A thioesterase PaaI-like protein
MHPKFDNNCFGCGIGNSQGLRLTFMFNSLLNIAESWYVPTEREMGALGIMHGGFVSLLLDEAMGKVLSGLGIKAPTAQLNVRFNKPTMLDKPIHIIGKLLEISGRKYSLKATIMDEKGNITAEANALFIKIKDKT